MAEHPNKSKRRLRMLYALKDIQFALSAADFLSECAPLNDAQENPDKFNFCHDWLFPE